MEEGTEGGLERVGRIMFSGATIAYVLLLFACGVMLWRGGVGGDFWNPRIWPAGGRGLLTYGTLSCMGGVFLGNLLHGIGGIRERRSDKEVFDGWRVVSGFSAVLGLWGAVYVAKWQNWPFVLIAVGAELGLVWWWCFCWWRARRATRQMASSPV